MPARMWHNGIQSFFDLLRRPFSACPFLLWQVVCPGRLKGCVMVMSSGLPNVLLLGSNSV